MSTLAFHIDSIQIMGVASCILKLSVSKFDSTKSILTKIDCAKEIRGRGLVHPAGRTSFDSAKSILIRYNGRGL